MIRFFASHPTAANLLMLAFLAAGLLSIPSIQRETFPDFSPTIVEARVVYPGAAPSDVEEAICRRIEDAVESVEYVKESRSQALDNFGTVVFEMADGGDPTVFLSDIKTEVEAITDFPDRAEPPSIRLVQRTDRVISVTVTGDMSDADLKTYALDLKDRMLRVPEISLVSVAGFGQRQIRIEVPALVLMKYGISAEGLASIIGAQSVDLPIGTLNTPDGDLVLRFTDERRTPGEFQDLVIVGAVGGGEIRLGDVATIQDVFEPEEERIIFDGRRAALLIVEKTKQEDTLNVKDAVASFLDKERARHPKGIHLQLTEDRSSIVKDRLEMLVRNGWQGLLLVFLSMWLFFGFRYSFWVTMGLPVAFLGALFVMPLVGMTINMLTMVALLMALGLLMDDAIVIAENVAHEVSKGGNILEATIRGVSIVAPGVLSSFLTTLAVFTPLAFLEGDIGKVLRAVPIVLIMVLAVSLVEAFLILPHHLVHSLEHAKHREPGLFRRRFDAGVAWFRENVVGKLADLAVSWRYLTVGLVIAAFLLSVGMLASGRVKFQAFPELDGDVAICRVLLRPGTPLERTEAVVKRITEASRKVDEEFTPRQPGGKQLVLGTVVRFNQNADANETGAHVATITLDLLPAESRSGRVDDILNRWRELVGQVPDSLTLVYTQGAFGPAGRPIELRIQGDDLDKLAEEAHGVEAFFRRFEGVNDLMSDLRPGKVEARIRMRPGSRSLGLTARSVATQLRTAFYGATASELQVGAENYEIDVRMAETDRNGLADLDYFHVTLPDGSQAPLGTVAEVEMARGYTRIAHLDGRRTVTVQGDVDTALANTAEITRLFKTELLPEIEARGFHVIIEGETSEGGRTQRSMLRGLLIGLIGIFFILSYQFGSYIEPLTVMAAIPLALIGVIWGHFALGIPITMPSMLGFASLAGIVVNDSILLVSFVDRRIREGATVADASRKASRDRFRAVMLTSLTTMLGMLPLLAETSLQAQILIPLAAAIVFGLLASTILVLFVIPALFTIFADLGFIRREQKA